MLLILEPRQTLSKAPLYFFNTHNILLQHRRPELLVHVNGKINANSPTTSRFCLVICPKFAIIFTHPHRFPTAVRSNYFGDFEKFCANFYLLLCKRIRRYYTKTKTKTVIIRYLLDIYYIFSY